MSDSESPTPSMPFGPLPSQRPPVEGAYVASLWQHPDLCLAIFGIQYHSEAGQRRYEAAGINEEMYQALQDARTDGLLLTRMVMEPGTGILLQYWRSYEDLDRWARKAPHSR